MISTRKLIFRDKETGIRVLMDLVEDFSIALIFSYHLRPFTLPVHGDASTNIPIANVMSLCAQYFKLQKLFTIREAL